MAGVRRISGNGLIQGLQLRINALGERKPDLRDNLIRLKNELENSVKSRQVDEEYDDSEFKAIAADCLFSEGLASPDRDLIKAAYFYVKNLENSDENDGTLDAKINDGEAFAPEFFIGQQIQHFVSFKKDNVQLNIKDDNSPAPPRLPEKYSSDPVLLAGSEVVQLLYKLSTEKDLDRCIVLLTQICVNYDLFLKGNKKKNYFLNIREEHLQKKAALEKTKEKETIEKIVKKESELPIRIRKALTRSRNFINGLSTHHGAVSLRQIQHLESLNRLIQAEQYNEAKMFIAEMCLGSTSIGRDINTSVGYLFDSAPTGEGEKTAIRQLVEGIYEDILIEENNALPSSEPEINLSNLSKFQEKISQYINNSISYLGGKTQKKPTPIEFGKIVVASELDEDDGSILIDIEVAQLLTKLDTEEDEGKKLALLTQLCLSYEKYLASKESPHADATNPFISMRAKQIDSMAPRMFKEGEITLTSGQNKLLAKIDKKLKGFKYTKLSQEKAAHLEKIKNALEKTDFNNFESLKELKGRLLQLQQGADSSIVDERRFPRISRFYKPTTTTFDLLRSALQLVDEAQKQLLKIPAHVPEKK